MAPQAGHTQVPNDFNPAANQDWNNPANWSGGTPTAASVARVPTNQQVDIGGAAQVGTLQVEGSGQVVVNPGGTLAAGTILLGTVPAPGAVASLLVDGSVSASWVSVGDAATGGQIIVTGAGASLNVAPPSLAAGDQFIVGNTGDGVLGIRSGSTVTVGGTRTLHLGRVGTGALIIGDIGPSGTLDASAVVLGNAGSSIKFNQNDATPYTFSAAISGTGWVEVFSHGGVSSTVLTGVNSYTGGTFIRTNGRLTGTTTSLQGAISNEGLLTFDQTANGTFAGSIGGSGTLIKEGAGTVILSGTNTYTGATIINGGTLRGTTASLQGFITNRANLEFLQAGNGTFAGVISGTGNVVKSGTGNVSFSGTNTYNGPTIVTGGTLSVNGSLTNSTVQVMNGGTLGGTGSVRNTTIQSGGALAPGNSIGTLTVVGNLTFNAGSNYSVEVDSAGSNDRTNATGTLTINGGTVNVLASAGTYSPSTQYTILNATGGRTGVFNGVNTNLAFLTPSLTYDPNNVYLTLARNSTGYNNLPGMTPNQQSASNALQDASGGASGDMSTVLSAINSLSAPQALAAFDAIGGANLVALRRAGPSFAAAFGEQLQTRVGRSNQGSVCGSDDIAGREALRALFPATEDGCGFWLRGYGGYQTTDSDGNAMASRLNSTGLSAGYDAEMGQGWLLGGAVTVGTSRVSFDSSDQGRARSTALAMYAAYADGAWRLNGLTSVAFHSNHMDRGIVVGPISRVASSNFSSSTATAYGELTYDLDMTGWTLQPMAALAFSRNQTNGFAEQGAGALNLQVAAQTVYSTKSLVGLKAGFDIGRLRIEPRLVWAHEFGQYNTPMTAQLQGAGTPYQFQIAGVALNANTVVLGVGVSGHIHDNFKLFADLQTEQNARQRNLALLMGVRGKW
ncbi:autotransporter outer membrane beta-barrel domain-containing protein [Polaromonas aquatica]|uniref:autotransporter outer membrane beta-barrel domain-containing protein n=1 Tax=Polaromonas aquatica TaxID=332657 RepID=UPI003D64DC54